MSVLHLKSDVSIINHCIWNILMLFGEYTVNPLHNSNIFIKSLKHSKIATNTFDYLSLGRYFGSSMAIISFKLRITSKRPSFRGINTMVTLFMFHRWASIRAYHSRSDRIRNIAFIWPSQITGIELQIRSRFQCNNRSSIGLPIHIYPSHIDSSNCIPG